MEYIFYQHNFSAEYGGVLRGGDGCLRWVDLLTVRAGLDLCRKRLPLETWIPQHERTRLLLSRVPGH